MNDSPQPESYWRSRLPVIVTLLLLGAGLVSVFVPVYSVI